MVADLSAVVVVMRVLVESFQSVSVNVVENVVQIFCLIPYSLFQLRISNGLRRPPLENLSMLISFLLVLIILLFNS